MQGYTRDAKNDDKSVEKDDTKDFTISGTGPEFDELAVGLSVGEYELRDNLPAETQKRLDDLLDALAEQVHTLGPNEEGSVEFRVENSEHWFNVLEVGAIENDLNLKGRMKALEVQKLVLDE